MYPDIDPQSKYFPANLCAINFSPLNIRLLIASVMCISPPAPAFNWGIILNISFGRIYLPITALLEGAFL